uniref:Uncharacterized protein n=1 Tax=Physcomitrium patens TaxID=3218 RepID=A0A2K1J2S3_PHYPA|nr:hypothetical protein PHYPA_021673 [Physcomitrium patens]
MDKLHNLHILDEGLRHPLTIKEENQLLASSSFSLLLSTLPLPYYSGNTDLWS